MNTLNFYNQNSSDLISRYDNAEMSTLHKLFFKYFKSNCSVLDIGFGSGRDLAVLKENGYDIWGIDPSKEFVDNVQNRFSNISNHFTQTSVPFQTKELPFNRKFDAIISIAMWMHLKHVDYMNIIKNIVSLANSKSTIVISYSKGTRSPDERYFEDVDLKYLTHLFQKHNFSLVESTENTDSLNRDNLTWITIVFKYD